MDPVVQHLKNEQGEIIAYAHLASSHQYPITIFYVPGYGAHKFSQKALHLLEYAKENQLAWASFDHLGCGESTGNMSAMGLDDYLNAAQLVLNAISPEYCLIIGSSFGAWLSALLAEKNACIKAFIGIAGAYDFTQFIYSKLNPEHHEELAEHQRLIIKLNSSDEDFIFSKKLLYQSKKWFVLNREIHLSIPVSLLHGVNDPDVPWQNSLAFMEKLTSPDVRFILLKNCGHRFIEPSALETLTQQTKHMIAAIRKSMNVP